MMVWAFDDPKWRRVELAFVVATGLLFTANVLVLLGIPVFGAETPFRPVATLAISGALLMQASADIVGRRSRRAAIALGVLSLVPLWIGVTFKG